MPTNPPTPPIKCQHSTSLRGECVGMFYSCGEHATTCLYAKEPPTPPPTAADLARDEEPALARALRRIAQKERMSSFDAPVLEDAAALLQSQAQQLAEAQAALTAMTAERDRTVLAWYRLQPPALAPAPDAARAAQEGTE